MRKIILCTLVLSAIITFAEVPHLISYQGRLTDDITGDPVPDSPYNITYRLFEVDGGGSAIWTENHPTVDVTGGTYCVMLGSNTPFPTPVDFSIPYWLEVQVGATTLSPRYELGASPYALNLASMNAVSGQVLKYDGGLNKWLPATDETGSGGGVGGSGTDNYIPRFNGTTDLENSNMFQADGGNVGIGTTTPSARLEIEGAPGTGMVVDNAGMDGLYINNSSDDGIHIQDPGMDGLHIENSFADGIDIRNAGGQGIQVIGASGPGLYLRNTPSMIIENAFNHGIQIDSCNWAGIFINAPAANGIDINPSTTSNCGIKIDSDYGFYPDTGIVIRGPNLYGMVIDSIGDGSAIFIRDPDWYGVHIQTPSVGVVVFRPSREGMYIYDSGEDGISIMSADSHGIYIDSTGVNGMSISNAGNKGIDITNTGQAGIEVNDAGTKGVVINYPGHEGVRVENSGWSSFASINSSFDGLVVNNPADDGVEVTTPGGNCFECDGAPYRLFRVSNKGDIYGHNHYSYIVDSEGKGIVTPIPRATGNWLEHIGEARLSGGECRVNLPEVFLNGVTITEDVPIQVFLNPYGDLGRYAVERSETYFIVRQIEGDPNAAFAYRVVAKVRGKEDDGVEYIDLKDKRDADREEFKDTRK